MALFPSTNRLPTVNSTYRAPVGATISGSASMGPLAAMLIPALIGAAGQGLSAFSGARSNRKQRESDERLTRDKLRQDREIADNRLALDESELDPFRALLAQIAAAEQMDRIASYEPLDFSGSPYASYIPKGNSGPSAEMRAAAGTGRTAALSGQGQATPIANRNQPGATNGVLDLLLNSRRGGRAPVSNTMPVPQPGGGLPVTDPILSPAGVTPDDDPLQPSFMAPTMRQPPSAARRRPPLRSRRRMAVAA